MSLSSDFGLRTAFSMAVGASFILYAGFDPFSIGAESSLLKGGEFFLYGFLYAPVISLAAPLIGWSAVASFKDSKYLKKGKPVKWLAEQTNTVFNITAGAFGALSAVIGGSYLSTQFFEKASRHFDPDSIRKAADLDENSINQLLNGDWTNGYTHLTNAVADVSLKDTIDGVKETLSQSGNIALDGFLSGTPEGLAAITVSVLTPVIGGVAGWLVFRPISRLPIVLHRNIFERTPKLEAAPKAKP